MSDVNRLLVARNNPDRAIYVSNRTGTWQVWIWNRKTNTHRRLTSHPHAVNYAAISPDGQRVVWFDDPNGGERGNWVEQRFDSQPGQERPLAKGLPQNRFTLGVAVGDEKLVTCLCDTQNGFEVFTVMNGVATRIYHSDMPLVVKTLSADEEFVALEDSLNLARAHHPQVRVLRTSDGSTVGQLDDNPPAAGPGSLIPVAFSPISGDSRLLVLHERGRQLTKTLSVGQRPALLLWDPVQKSRDVLYLPPPLAPGATDEALGTPREVAQRWGVDRYEQLAAWSPDGSCVVAAYDYGAYTTLVEHNLDGEDSPRTFPTDKGRISELTPDPRGGMYYRWGTVGHPWQYRSIAESEGPGNESGLEQLQSELPAPSGLADSLSFYEVKLPGDGGWIPVFVIKPPSAPQSPNQGSVVIRVPGGPAASVGNEPQAPWVYSLLEQGVPVVTLNYRGSFGSGSRWKNAMYGRGGIPGSDDVASLLRDLRGESEEPPPSLRRIERGTGISVDPVRMGMVGNSFGGNLTLLTVARCPGSVRAAVAIAPISHIEAHEDPHARPELKPLFTAWYGRLPDSGEWALAGYWEHLREIRDPTQVLLTGSDRRGAGKPSMFEVWNLEGFLTMRRHVDVMVLDGGHNSNYQTRHQATSVDAQILAFLAAHGVLPGEGNSSGHTPSSLPPAPPPTPGKRPGKGYPM